MSGYSNSPKLVKGGLVVLTPGGATPRRVISLQSNPDSFVRSYQVQGVGGEDGGERAQPFSLKGPVIESIKLDTDIDATDSLEHSDQNANAVAFGIAAQLAALESLVNPSTVELLALNVQGRNVERSVKVFLFPSDISQGAKFNVSGTIQLDDSAYK